MFPYLLLYDHTIKLISSVFDSEIFKVWAGCKAHASRDYDMPGRPHRPKTLILQIWLMIKKAGNF